ncbi:hypothetical protein D3C79_921120 [compost metagenome]
MVVEFDPRPEANAARLQLVALPGAEVLEGQVELAIAPQRLVYRAYIARGDRELVAHGQFVAAGGHFKVARVGPVAFVNLDGVQRGVVLGCEVDPRLVRIGVRQGRASGQQHECAGGKQWTHGETPPWRDSLGANWP